MEVTREFIYKIGDEPCIKILNWNLELVASVGQITGPDKPFYLPVDMASLKVKNDCYYILEEAKTDRFLRIVDATSGKCLKRFQVDARISVLLHIDSDNRLIFSKNGGNQGQDSLVFMSQSGHVLKEKKFLHEWPDWTIDDMNTLFGHETKCIRSQKIKIKRVRL